MALGKPIVSTSIGTEGIATSSESNILIANSKDEFIKAISGLITDNEIYTKISRNAIEYIHEKFDNLALSGALSGFYKKHTA
jgi:glycosyltransferase involved in cell wall biosynthesis